MYILLSIRIRNQSLRAHHKEIYQAVCRAHISGTDRSYAATASVAIALSALAFQNMLDYHRLMPESIMTKNTPDANIAARKYRYLATNRLVKALLSWDGENQILKRHHELDLAEMIRLHYFTYAP